MQRAVIFSVIILTAVSSANASTHYVMTYHDTIRPHGHPRSDKIYDASLDACYSATGADRTAADTPAFKKCMSSKGYRWQSTKLARDPAPAADEPAADDSSAADQAAAEEAFDDEQRRNDEQRREQQQTQDMINTQNMINTQQMIDQANQAAAAASQ